jgi:hypothetical protein
MQLKQKTKPYSMSLTNKAMELKLFNKAMLLKSRNQSHEAGDTLARAFL